MAGQPRLRDLWSTAWAPVAGAVLLAWVMRIPFVSQVPFPDEGGLLLVAGDWHAGGPQLYGWLFVDRPPGVLLFFLLAHALGGVVAARLLGLGLVLLLVAAAGRAGWLLAGRRGAAWAAWVAAALAANPLLGTHEINAEIVGAPLVMASCALALGAVRGDRGVRLLLAAGLLAGAAPMVKQNLVDGLVFAVALVAATAHRDRWSRPRTAAGLGWLGLGASIPLLGTLLWAGGPGPGVGVLWRSLVQFRVTAAEVVASTPSPAMERRLSMLPTLAVLSGLALIALVSLWQARDRRREPVMIAVAALTATEIAGAALGGSYWAHYLIALIPGAALLTALAARREDRAWLMRAALGVAVASALVGSVVSLTPAVTRASTREQALVGWLREARRPGDTGAVTFGQADILEAAGLRPGYPLLWSLPVRALDPRLDRLTRQVRRPDGPDWIVETMPPDTWGLDPRGRTQRAIDQHFRLVATICGTPVYLRVGHPRVLPPPPSCGPVTG